jgi:hypothetical protein
MTVYPTNGETMKKAIIALLASITLVGCGTTKTVVVERTVPETPVTTPQAQYGTDNYIANISSEYPHLINNLGKPWLIDFAETVCSSIDDGATLSDFVKMSTQYNIDAGMLGFLLGESIRNFCPSNQWFIDAALAA